MYGIRLTHRATFRPKFSLFLYSHDYDDEFYSVLKGSHSEIFDELEKENFEAGFPAIKEIYSSKAKKLSDVSQTLSYHLDTHESSFLVMLSPNENHGFIPITITTPSNLWEEFFHLVCEVSTNIFFMRDFQKVPLMNIYGYLVVKNL